MWIGEGRAKLFPAAINSPRHGEVEHTRRSLAKCRIARISSSASMVLSKGNSTEEAHSRSRRLNLTSEKKRRLVKSRLF